MYYLKNGKKEKYVPPTKEKYKSLAVSRNIIPGDNNKKWPTWVFFIIGILAVLVVGWLIHYIINNKM